MRALSITGCSAQYMANSPTVYSQISLLYHDEPRLHDVIVMAVNIHDDMMWIFLHMVP